VIAPFQAVGFTATSLFFRRLGFFRPVAMAKEAVAGWSTGKSMTRDLTDGAETLGVLQLASEMLASGIPLEEIKKECYGDSTVDPPVPPGSAIVISAVDAACSKQKLAACGAFHMTCVYAMFGEQNRIKQKAEHENGQDFVRIKVKQLQWLFEGAKPEQTWDIIAVDDGCPNDSIGLARAVVAAEGYESKVMLHTLEEMVDNEFFSSRGLKAGCKDSRKGGAILYGLKLAADRAKLAAEGTANPHYVMYTDSDLSTDMALCGLLAAGMQTDGCAMAMGARYGMPGTFLVKPPDMGALGHPQSHFDQPNMMKIVFRHFTRAKLLPMLSNIYDTQCAFKCFNCADVNEIIKDCMSLGPDFDMEVLLCALSMYGKRGVEKAKTCKVYPTLFTEDFAESNFMASSSDPDKPFKTYLGMVAAVISMHERFIDQESESAKAAQPYLAFFKTLDLPRYKKMIQTLEAELGKTLFDYEFTLEQLEKAAA